MRARFGGPRGTSRWPFPFKDCTTDDPPKDPIGLWGSGVPPTVREGDVHGLGGALLESTAVKAVKV
jgi:hypothetical protein